jgi:hypothetical protein
MFVGFRATLHSSVAGGLCRLGPVAVGVRVTIGGIRCSTFGRCACSSMLPLTNDRTRIASLGFSSPRPAGNTSDAPIRPCYGGVARPYF